MSVRVDDYHPKVKIGNTRAINLALRFTLDDIDRAAFNITPKDKGELRKNLKKQVGANSASIEWSSNYAVYQERGYSSGPIRRYTTPGTGPHFAEKAVQVGVSQLLPRYLEAMRII